jgi:N-acetylglucosamine-6-phosphate deacetylase
LEPPKAKEFESAARTSPFSMRKAQIAASTAPALAVGLEDTGSIEAGKCADLVILDKDLNLVAVFVDGEKVVG